MLHAKRFADEFEADFVPDIRSFTTIQTESLKESIKEVFLYSQLADKPELLQEAEAQLQQHWQAKLDNITNPQDLMDALEVRLTFEKPELRRDIIAMCYWYQLIQKGDWTTEQASWGIARQLRKLRELLAPTRL